MKFRKEVTSYWLRLSRVQENRKTRLNAKVTLKDQQVIFVLLDLQNSKVGAKLRLARLRAARKAANNRNIFSLISCHMKERRCLHLVHQGKNGFWGRHKLKQMTTVP